jgi:hypothetical protein
MGHHHAKGLLNAQVKGWRMRWETCPPRARRRLASELPACATPSSTSWQTSSAAARNSSNSYCEEL